ncbi:MAG TPA: hypothetical protein VKZ72_10265 [Acidimicrobiales bacterium]|jgi:hypothetical protein|nr:hypothetical protein [Acidimicrobiales bacterium]
MGGPDPLEEPEGGAASGSRPEGAPVEKADNAEEVLDPDAEGDHPEEGAAAQVDRMERHNRSRSTSGGD